MAYTVSTHTLPAHWAPFLVNGDRSGYAAEDLESIESWLYAMDYRAGSCLSCSDEPFYTRIHEGTRGLICDCLEYHFPLEV